ncbi:MAG: T9SS type A sorting domain-containing protein [Cyclobacteriaceae bacterium]
MKDLDEYFDKAVRQEEIVPLAKIDEILSSKKQRAQNQSPNFLYALFQRKEFGLAMLSTITILIVSIMIFFVIQDKTHVDEEVFVPQAQRRVMHLVKNISAHPNNREITVSQFGSTTNPEETAIPIHLRSKFELSEDKLKLLGITFSDTLVKYEGNAKGKGYVRFSVPKASAETPFLKVDIRLLIGPIRAGIKEYEFYPWFLTNENGLQGPRYEFGGREPSGKMTNSFFLSAIDELIPIQIDRPGFAKVIFWFSQTPELMSILESATMISKNTEMLDVPATNRTNSTIEIEIFPTITKRDVQVVTNVLKKQKLEITLLNSSGDVLQVPVNNHVLEKGDHSFSIDLSTFEKGLYFVRIKSDPGLITIHRLFKE